MTCGITIKNLWSMPCSHEERKIQSIPGQVLKEIIAREQNKFGKKTILYGSKNLADTLNCKKAMLGPLAVKLLKTSDKEKDKILKAVREKGNYL